MKLKFRAMLEAISELVMQDNKAKPSSVTSVFIVIPRSLYLLLVFCCAVASRGIAGHVASWEIHVVKLPAVRSQIQATTPMIVPAAFPAS